MVATTAILFLLGTINSLIYANPLNPTEVIIEKHLNPEFSEKLTNYGLSSGLPPFISNFMQHGTNVFFKPQFMLSPTYVAPGQGMIFENKEDCKKWPMMPAIPFAARPEIVMEEPLKVVETIVTDGQPPIVDKVIVIKPPVPMAEEIVSAPMFIPPVPGITELAPMVLPYTPELPALPFVPVSVDTVPMEQVNVKPEPIPAAPELPALELPQAPLVFDVPVEIKPTLIPEAPELIPVSVPEIVLPPIPEAPELPPMLEIVIPPIPELPAVSMPEIELPSIPELPPVSMPEIVLPPLPEPEPIPFVIIPQAPELPPYSPPKLPLPVVMPVKDCDKTPIFVPSQPTVEEVEPMIVPLPPVLPYPAEFPMDLVVPQSLPNMIVEINEKPMDIPPAPVLPEFQLPVFPEIVAPYPEPAIMQEENPAVSIAIPSPPELPPMSLPELPASVLPEPIHVFPELPMVIEPKPILIEEPKYEPVEIPAAPVLPPMAPISFPETPFYTTVEQEVVTNEIPFVEVPEYLKPIPQAPLLPFLPLPEIPSPVTVEEIKVSEPSNIPAAPELLPMHYPSMPIMFEEPMSALYPPAGLTPMIIEEPKLPQLEIPNRPLFMTFAEPPRFSMSQVDSVISFPTSCVKNIVVERVLPNMVHDGLLSSPHHPVLSTYSPTVGIRLY